jgi:DNA-directed RNA polymerase subunit RPC12/RpoP
MLSMQRLIQFAERNRVMVSVIRYGPENSVPKEISCNRCESLLEYTKTDVKSPIPGLPWHSYPGTDYVVCPACNHRVAVR